MSGNFHLFSASKLLIKISPISQNFPLNLVRTFGHFLHPWRIVPELEISLNCYNMAGGGSSMGKHRSFKENIWSNLSSHIRNWKHSDEKHCQNKTQLKARVYSQLTSRLNITMVFSFPLEQTSAGQASRTSKREVIRRLGEMKQSGQSAAECNDLSIYTSEKTYTKSSWHGTKRACGTLASERIKENELKCKKSHIPKHC